ncbi:MAG TPA: hypothetical protein VI814_05075 [Candidatus Limnocylindria bacterium]
MDQQLIVWVVAAVVVVALLVAFWMVSQQRRRTHLREQFGPEYERVVSQEGDQGRAERVLSQREERVKKLDIRQLPAAAREDFIARWRQVQARFVDDPRGAVGDADALIGDAMKARGYPVGDFEQRAADISVEHPDVVTDYRAAHRVALQREASTEELRRAMVHYRSLFDDVVGRNERGARDERARGDEREDERLEEREETQR